jgi:hypothetical protein
VSVFIAVGHNGLRLSSPDGTRWEHEQLGKEGEIYRAAVYGNGLFAAVGSYGGDNIVAASANGMEWKTAKNAAKYSKYFRGLVFGNGQFIAVGGDPVTVGAAKPFVATSRDGIEWSAFQEISGKFILRRVAAGDGLFVGIGDRGRRSWSRDGVHWQDVEKVKAVDTMIDVAFGNGVFVGVGMHGLRMSTSDGAAWSDPIRGHEGEHLNSILWTGKEFVAVGAGVTYKSPDGQQWTSTPNVDAPTTAVFGRGVFVGSSWKGRILRSSDGVQWVEVFKAPQHVEAFAFGGT